MRALALLLCGSLLAGCDATPRRPGYLVSPPASELMRNAVPLPDGRMMIPAGGHSPAVNAYHQRLCEIDGMRDATDATDLTFSGARDAFVCVSDVPARPRAASPTTLPIETDSDGRYYIPLPARTAPPGSQP